jgi:hypothetical protein
MRNAALCYQEAFEIFASHGDTEKARLVGAMLEELRHAIAASGSA